MPNYTDAALKEMRQAYIDTGDDIGMSFLVLDDILAARARIAELEGQIATEESEDESDDLQAIVAAALIYRSTAPATERHKEVATAFKKAYDDVVKSAGLETAADARGGASNE